MTTALSSLTFTCFKCDRSFRLRIHLHSHVKKCKTKDASYDAKKTPSCDKYTFMGLLKLQLKVKPEDVNPEPPSCAYKVRDGFIVIDDDEEEEDLYEVYTKKSKEKQFLLPKSQKVLKGNQKSKIKLYASKRVLHVDCSSAMGQLIDYRKSSIKNYISKVCVVRDYDKWCDGTLQKRKLLPLGQRRGLKYNMTFKPPPGSPLDLIKKCSISLFRLDKSRKYKKYFMNEVSIVEEEDSSVVLMESSQPPPIQNNITPNTDHPLPSPPNILSILMQPSQIVSTPTDQSNSDTSTTTNPTTCSTMGVSITTDIVISTITSTSSFSVLSPVSSTLSHTATTSTTPPLVPSFTTVTYTPVQQPANFTDSGFIRRVYSIAPEALAMATVVEDDEEEKEEEENEDDDCYVYRVDLSRQDSVKPVRFSLSCFLCHEIIVDNTSSHENIKRHYSTKHQISDFTLKASQTDDGKVWKLVEAKHKHHKQPPQNTIIPISSHVFQPQDIDSISLVTLPTSACAQNLWSSAQQKDHHPFYSDVICID